MSRSKAATAAPTNQVEKEVEAMPLDENLDAEITEQLDDEAISDLNESVESVESESAAAGADTEADADDAELPDVKIWRYRVTNARIGHEVGAELTYDHEPDVVFLACLEPIED